MFSGGDKPIDLFPGLAPCTQDTRVETKLVSNPKGDGDTIQMSVLAPGGDGFVLPAPNNPAIAASNFEANLSQRYKFFCASGTPGVYYVGNREVSGAKELEFHPPVCASVSGSYVDVQGEVNSNFMKYLTGVFKKAEASANFMCTNPAIQSDAKVVKVEGNKTLVDNIVKLIRADSRRARETNSTIGGLNEVELFELAEAFAEAYNNIPSVMQEKEGEKARQLQLNLTLAASGLQITIAGAGLAIQLVFLKKVKEQLQIAQTMLSQQQEMMRLMRTQMDQVSGLDLGDKTALQKYGRDLTEEARTGRLEPMNRDLRTGEIERIRVALNAHKNIALTGQPGVGKTAIVEGLAWAIANGEIPELAGARIIQLDLNAMEAGTGVRGSFENRLKAVLNEIEKLREAGENIILFIDEMHRVISLGAAKDKEGAAQTLKEPWARGKLPTIGATTDEEYERDIARDKALGQRFRRVNARPFTPEETFQALSAKVPYFGRAEGVFPELSISENVLREIVTVSDALLPNDAFPRKADSFLQEVIGYYRTEQARSGQPEKATELTMNAVREWADILRNTSNTAQPTSAAEALPEMDLREFRIRGVMQQMQESSEYSWVTTSSDLRSAAVVALNEWDTLDARSRHAINEQSRLTRMQIPRSGEFQLPIGYLEESSLSLFVRSAVDPTGFAPAGFDASRTPSSTPLVRGTTPEKRETADRLYREQRQTASAPLSATPREAMTDNATEDATSNGRSAEGSMTPARAAAKAIFEMNLRDHMAELTPIAVQLWEQYDADYKSTHPITDNGMNPDVINKAFAIWQQSQAASPETSVPANGTATRTPEPRRVSVTDLIRLIRTEEALKDLRGNLSQPDFNEALREQANSLNGDPALRANLLSNGGGFNVGVLSTMLRARLGENGVSAPSRPATPDTPANDAEGDVTRRRTGIADSPDGRP